MVFPIVAQQAAHDRFARVRGYLEQDWPVADIATAEGLSLPATYNLIARTRRHYGSTLGLRPPGSEHSPARYGDRRPDHADPVDVVVESEELAQ